MWRCLRQNSLYMQVLRFMIPRFCGVTLHLLSERLPMFLRTVMPSSLRVIRSSHTFRPDNADGTYHSHPTAHNDIPEDQNRLQFVSHTWEHRPMHDESLHTPPALQALKHWYVLNVYQLLCLSMVKFTLHRSLSVFKEAQSEKTVDIMLELSPLGYFNLNNTHNWRQSAQ